MVLRSSRSRRDERGGVAIMVAVLATTLFVIAALVVDLGFARDVKRQSQNASDASALAAANALYPDSGTCQSPMKSGFPINPAPPCVSNAVERAMTYGEVNFGVSSWNCDAVPTGFQKPAWAPSTCVSFDSLTDPTKVWVVMPIEDVATGLGTLAGVDHIPVGTRAQAQVDAGQTVDCALCFTGSVNSKKFTVDIDGGGIAINGSVNLHPGGIPWQADSIAYLETGSFSGPDATPPATTTPPFDDPWANDARIPLSLVGLDKYTDPDDHPCDKGPGIYGAREFGSDCTLTPGLYVFTGAVTSKNKEITATGGVTIYATCGTVAAPVECSGTPGASLDFKNADLNLEAPTSGPRAGLGIVMDRENPAPLSLQGNGLSNVVGAIYAPASNFDYNGTSDVVVSGGPVILNSMTGNGDTGLVIKNAIDTVVKELPGDIGLSK